MRTPESPWTITTSREIYRNPWIRVREDEVIRPDGERGIYGVMSMQNASVFVVALTDTDEVLMVSLYRYPTRGMSLEVPAGGCDGDDPLVAARRELLEETGHTATTWREIGRMNALNGVCDAPEHVFLATGLHQQISTPGAATVDTVDTAHEQTVEGIDAVTRVPWHDAMRKVSSGEITDGETVAALMFAALALGKL